MAPLPDAALKAHPTKKFLTQISPAFVIERLNEVFGIDGWHAEYVDIESHDFMQNTKDGPIEKTMIVKKCRLSVNIGGVWHLIEQYGGNDNDDRGDAHKGAATDALTKCASYVGVGLYVYKGELDGKRPGQQDNQPQSKSNRLSNRTQQLGTRQPQLNITELTERYIELIGHDLIAPEERAKGMGSIEKAAPEKIPSMIQWLENLIAEREAKVQSAKLQFSKVG